MGSGNSAPSAPKDASELEGSTLQERVAKLEKLLGEEREKVTELEKSAIGASKKNRRKQQNTATLERRAVKSLADALKAKRRADALREVAHALSHTCDLESLLAKLAKLSRSVVKAERCSIYLVDAEKGDLYTTVAEKTKAIRVPMGIGIAGQCCSSGKIINLKDAYADVRFNRENDKQTGYVTKTILCAPIVSMAGEKLGVIQFINKIPRGTASVRSPKKSPSPSLYSSRKMRPLLRGSMVDPINTLTREVLGSSSKSILRERSHSGSTPDLSQSLPGYGTSLQPVKRKNRKDHPRATIITMPTTLIKGGKRSTKLGPDDVHRAVSTGNLQELRRRETNDVALDEEDLHAVRIDHHHDGVNAGTIAKDEMAFLKDKALEAEQHEAQWILEHDAAEFLNDSDTFTKEDEEIVLSFCDSVAIALSNVALWDDLERTSHLMAIVLHAALEFAKILDIEQLQKKATETILTHIPCRGAALYLVPKDRPRSLMLHHGAKEQTASSHRLRKCRSHRNSPVSSALSPAKTFGRSESGLRGGTVAESFELISEPTAEMPLVRFSRHVELEADSESDGKQEQVIHGGKSLLLRSLCSKQILNTLLPEEGVGAGSNDGKDAEGKGVEEEKGKNTVEGMPSREDLLAFGDDGLSWKSMLTIPIPRPGSHEPYGVVQLLDRHVTDDIHSAEAGFSSIDVQTVTAIISTLGICIEKCRLYGEAIHAKELEEEVQQLHIEEEAQNHLLRQMLPEHIIETLKHVDREGERQAIGANHEEVFVLFSDIESFTPMSSAMSPMRVVKLLNNLFSKFDSVCDECKVYKVETIGDAYMVTSGLDFLKPRVSPARDMLDMALGMMDAVLEHNRTSDVSLRIRIGIHCGPVVAGVVGVKMPRYCLFGDTVNTAARMESGGVPGCIQLSESAFNKIREVVDDANIIKDRGEVEVKGKGTMRTFLIETKLSEAVPWVVTEGIVKSSN